MAAMLRRVPRLASRGLACATPAALPAAAAAGKARGLLGLASAPADQQAAVLRAAWDQGSSGRWFSAVAEPEGGATEEAPPAAAADADVEAAGPVAEEAAAVEEAVVPAEAAAGHSRGADRAAKPNPRQIFVNNMAWSVDEQALAAHFSQVGAVTAARIARRAPDVSLGYGFVEFETAEAAVAACEQLNGSEMDGRTIGVREDRGGRAHAADRQQRQHQPRQERQPLRQQRRPVGDRSGEPSTRVVVHGLPFSLEWQDFKDMVQRVLADAGADPGAVWRADVRLTADGASRGWGILLMGSIADAELVIQALNGSTLEGRFLTAKFDEFAQGGRQEGGRGQREPRGAAPNHGDYGDEDA